MHETPHPLIDMRFYYQAVQYLHDRVTGDDKTDFEHLILKSDEHWKAYVDIVKIWSMSGELIVPESEGDRPWHMLVNRLSNEREKEKESIKKSVEKDFFYYSQKRHSPVQSVVAVFIGVILLLLFIYYFQQSATLPVSLTNEEPTLIEITTAKGERVTLRLSDGTTVVLNSDSKLITPDRFKENQRQISLEGEAYFDVRHFEDYPFRLIAGNTMTTVVGTRFNVRERKGAVQIVVEEGCVDVMEIHNEKQRVATLLSSGDMTVYNPKDGLMHVSPVNTDDYLAWRFGRLVFCEASIVEVFDEIERTYDVNYILIDPALEKRKLTGQFFQEQLDDILQDIALAMDLHIERRGKSIKIYP